MPCTGGCACCVCLCVFVWSSVVDTPATRCPPTRPSSPRGLRRRRRRSRPTPSRLTAAQGPPHPASLRLQTARPVLPRPLCHCHQHRPRPLCLVGHLRLPQPRPPVSRGARSQRTVHALPCAGPALGAGLRPARCTPASTGARRRRPWAAQLVRRRQGEVRTVGRERGKGCIDAPAGRSRMAE